MFGQMCEREQNSFGGTQNWQLLALLPLDLCGFFCVQLKSRQQSELVHVCLQRMKVLMLLSLSSSWRALLCFLFHESRPSETTILVVGNLILCCWRLGSLLFQLDVCDYSHQILIPCLKYRERECKKTVCIISQPQVLSRA